MLRVDCADREVRRRGIQAAASAARRGGLVLMPTESVYAIATDAFSVAGVTAVRRAKGQPRSMPLPVMVPSASTVLGIAVVPMVARDLMTAFWPGALTLLVSPQPTLAWDLPADLPLAVRMPLHPVALALLEQTGPLVATGANRAGLASASSVDDAVDQLGEVFAVALDAGELDADLRLSTVVDVTGPAPLLQRAGAVSADVIREICPDLREASPGQAEDRK